MRKLKVDSKQQPEVAQPLEQNVTFADCRLPSVLITPTLHMISIADVLGFIALVN